MASKSVIYTVETCYEKENREFGLIFWFFVESKALFIPKSREQEVSKFRALLLRLSFDRAIVGEGMKKLCMTSREYRTVTGVQVGTTSSSRKVLSFDVSTLHPRPPPVLFLLDLRVEKEGTRENASM